MAGKSDARVRYTQHALKQALLTLLKEKSVNKITVKEVCELAELNYSDCFALLEAIENELLEAFAQSLTLIKSFDVAALIEAIYDMIGKNEEACRVLIFQNPGSTVIHRMIDYARPQSIAYWRQELRASDEELEMLYTHLSNGLMHVVVEGYDRYERETVVRFVRRIVQASLSLFQ